IARALMNGGRIILADEPTGALDSKSGAEVMTLLRELADAGHTIILITHDRSVASQARRVIEIHDGQIVADTRTPDSEPAAAGDDVPLAGGDTASTRATPGPMHPNGTTGMAYASDTANAPAAVVMPDVSHAHGD